MGLFFKGFQKLAYTGLEKSREKGIKVDKERQKQRALKRQNEFDDTVGVNWGYLNKHWHDALYGEDSD